MAFQEAVSLKEAEPLLDQKVFRAAAKRFLRNVDKYFRVVSGKGLIQFVRDSEVDLWDPKNWREWPYLGLALDQGPDIICGGMALITNLRPIVTCCLTPHTGQIGTFGLPSGNRI